MSTSNIRNRIADSLACITGSSWSTEATALLDALGYRSDVSGPEMPGGASEFVATFPAQNPNTQTERGFLESAESVRLLFQLSDRHVAESVPRALFDAAGFDTGNARSFLFAAVQLHGDAYPRGQYAAFTRELNKRFQMPMVVLFRTTANRITLAFVHRRTNKRDPERDVLGSVSLIREINAAEPHRAHLDILAELSLPERLKWMDTHGKPHNFDGLLDAWLAALDTEELNKRFYKELFTWFERAAKTAKFPTEEARTLPAEEHVIRLITRLMFVWFIKEKGLVAEELFIENRAAELLKDYSREGGDSYYRAVLQNLFFATLNTEIEQRGFSAGDNSTHREFSYYRYRKEMADPDALLALFDVTPFINGGLFDCLDSFEGQRAGGYRIDCFSDVHYGKLSIPNRLFFGDANEPGLIDLFNRYKFTVEENTPTEQEVALDPELLGKVFENLLAAVNPETQLTARKETGSYYTPRAVVNYMVDEALIATLAQKASPADGDADYWQTRLRCLLDYGDAFADAETLFTPEERWAIVRAVAGIKVLDPAVGSGAFPMGVLHKLTLALRRLDERNELWEQVQRDEAANRSADAYRSLSDDEQRQEALDEIENTFRRYRETDFGRKLYLIQNSIYGVDIQPIATQIAKLRFFISLAIEQESNDDPSDNYGIRPLPNLETRFVAANTLIGLQLNEAQQLLQDEAIDAERKAIAQIRARHFLASNRQQKYDLVQEEKQCRAQLEQELDNLADQWEAARQREIEQRVAQLPRAEQREQMLTIELEKHERRRQQFDASLADARKIARWDPHDPNANAADWFDPGFMFNVTDGFDVSIGNPPYVRSEGSEERQQMRARIADSRQYETLHEKWDLYIPFVERAYKLLKPNGFTTMIVSDAYCHARYAKRSREWFLSNGRVARLDFFSKIRIFEAGVRNIVYLFQKADGQRNEPERRVHFPEFGNVELLPTDEQRNLTDRAFFPEDVNTEAICVPTIPLQNICYISYGLRPSSKLDARENFVTADVTSTTRDAIHCKPFVEGKHLDRWLPATNLWLEWDTARAPSQFYAPTFNELYEVEHKLLVQRSPGPDPKACYDDQQFVFTPSSVGFILWQDLEGVRNRSIQKQARYQDEKRGNVKTAPREQLEQTSGRFSIKFLLGFLNSTAARNSLRANRRSNVHLYPDDWKQLQIPDVAIAQQEPVINCVDRILKSKAANPAADTSADEAEIDRLVYALYGLTDAEIAAVAGS